MSIPSFIYGPFWSSASTGLRLKRSFSLLTPYFSDTSKHASSPPLFTQPGCPRTYLHNRDRLSPLAAHAESRAKARWGCPTLMRSLFARCRQCRHNSPAQCSSHETPSRPLRCIPLWTSTSVTAVCHQRVVQQHQCFPGVAEVFPCVW